MNDTVEFKKKLLQYTSLKKEIDELNNRIKKMTPVVDSVKGSRAEFPYDEKEFTVAGVNPLKFTLDIRKNLCEKTLLEIEQFINSIPDSRTRRVFVMRYVESMQWDEIAREIGARDESYPRKIIHDKYLKKI